METNDNKKHKQEDEIDDVQSKRSKIGAPENIIFTEQSRLKDIPEIKEKS